MIPASTNLRGELLTVLLDAQRSREVIERSGAADGDIARLVARLRGLEDDTRRVLNTR